MHLWLAGEIHGFFLLSLTNKTNNFKTLCTFHIMHGFMVSCRYETSGSGNYTLWQAGQVRGRRSRAEFLSKSTTPKGKLWNSPKIRAAWSNSPVKGSV